jgi:glycosyl hydrolase family 76
MSEFHRHARTRAISARSLIALAVLAGAGAPVAAQAAHPPVARAGATAAAAAAKRARHQPAVHKRLTPAQARAVAVTRRNQQHALSAYTAMQSTYYRSALGLYPGADAWPYSQAMAATISIAALPGLHQRFRPDLIARLRGLQAYADHVDPSPAGYVAQAPPPSSGGTRFNDDNEWIGIELLRLYHLNRQPQLRTSAQQLLDMVDAQWYTQPKAACPGGVPWESITINHDRNTVSNATGAELGAQLFLTTHNAQDLSWAQRMYGWVRGCLLNSDGLYGDHISFNNSIDSTEWTYNQGTMIGAGVMLYQATRDPTYLQEAQATAQAALAAFGPAQLAIQPTFFNAIYIRNLLLLGGASGDPRYGRFAQWYADDAWNNVRDFDSDLFLSGPGGTTELLDQAAMVQVYALLAGPPSAYF